MASYIPPAATSEWSSPPQLIEQLQEEFGRFDLDPCATASNAVADRFFTIMDNGLAQHWGEGVVFMNPPYGRGVEDWVRKAFESSIEGATVVCLLPVRSDAAWWHDYVMKGEIRFIRGRLRYGGATQNAPFASAVVIFFPPITGE